MINNCMSALWGSTHNAVEFSARYPNFSVTLPCPGCGQIQKNFWYLVEVPVKLLLTLKNYSFYSLKTSDRPKPYFKTSASSAHFPNSLAQRFPGTVLSHCWSLSGTALSQRECYIHEATRHYLVTKEKRWVTKFLVFSCIFYINPVCTIRFLWKKKTHTCSDAK